jgi:flagellar basal body-associated protein FliL
MKKLVLIAILAFVNIFQAQGMSYYERAAYEISKQEERARQAKIDALADYYQEQDIAAFLAVMSALGCCVAATGHFICENIEAVIGGVVAACSAVGIYKLFISGQKKWPRAKKQDDSRRHVIYVVEK